MSRKQPKDKNAPKRAQSSYFLFSNERRPILQSEHKDKKITEISKLISAEWKELEPTVKEEYQRRAGEGKKEYELKLAEYKKTESFQQHQAKVTQWKENNKDKAYGGKATAKGKNNNKGPKKPKQPESMPKRPQSSYFVFNNSRRGQLKEQYPDKKITEFAKMMAVEWRAFSIEDKKQYEDQAKVNKDRYNTAMAEYKKTEEFANYQKQLAEFKIAKKRFDADDGNNDNDGNGDGMKPIKLAKLPKKPKDPNCPKKALTSYFLYVKEMREKTKSEDPTQKQNSTAFSKECGAKWKLLTAEEQKPYSDEAARLKAIYATNIAQYKESDSAKEFQLKLAEWKEQCNKIKKENQVRQNVHDSRQKMKMMKIREKQRRARAMHDDSSSDDDSSDSSSSSSGSDSDSDSDSDSGSSSSSYDSSSDSSEDSDMASSDRRPQVNQYHVQQNGY